jgi:hypothetical protein
MRRRLASSTSAATPAAAIAAAGSGPVHIRLELRVDGDCFAGRAISDGGSREFHGWMGLMGAIEALYPPAAAPK